MPLFAQFNGGTITNPLAINTATSPGLSFGGSATELISTTVGNSSISIQANSAGNGSVTLKGGGTTNGRIDLQPNNSQCVSLQSDTVIRATFINTAQIGWASGNPQGSQNDTAFARAAAGVVEFNNGTTGTKRWFAWAGTSRVTTQFDKTNNTLADITGLTVNLLASRVYTFEVVLYTTSNVAAGVKFAISGTAGVTAIIYEAVVNQTAVDVATGTQRTTTLGTAVGDITAVTTAYARITGTWSVSTAGTMTVQFAQNANNAAASSVLVGSSLTVFDAT